MKKNIALFALITLIAGCGGDSTNDGSKGPSSNRINTVGYQSNTAVEIEAVKRFNMEGIAVDIALSENGRIAYVASGDNGLEVIDVSSPSSPRVIYSYDLPEYINYVEVDNGVVYAAYVPEGIQSHYSVHAFDIYNPARPYYLGSSQGKSGVGHDSAVRDDYYYEVNSAGLEIFRSADRVYHKVGSYYLHDSAYALALHRNYVFIANGRVGLTILKTNLGGVTSKIGSN